MEDKECSGDECDMLVDADDQYENEGEFPGLVFCSHDCLEQHENEYL